MAGQPKRFKNSEMLMKYIEEFFEAVMFDPEIGAIYAPTKTDFCVWLKREKGFSCDRKTLYTSLESYFPAVKSKFDEIRSDALIKGSMLGRYQPTATIFALKNWCGWKDKQEVDLDTSVEVNFGNESKEWAE